jgi:hypothetical protein
MIFIMFIFIILPTLECIAYKALGCICILYLVAVSRCTENLLDGETDVISQFVAAKERKVASICSS